MPSSLISLETNSSFRGLGGGYKKFLYKPVAFFEKVCYNIIRK